MKKYSFIFFISILGLVNFISAEVHFKENKGQWPRNVLFGTVYSNAHFYVNKKGFTFCIYNQSELMKGHEKQHLETDKYSLLHGHSYSVNFPGGLFDKVITQGESTERFNYFLGNDKSKWATQVKAYENLTFTNVYQGIDIKINKSIKNIKYDIVVHPLANSQSIQLKYENTDGIIIKEGKLTIKTSVGDVTETIPMAYQLIHGEIKKVKCNYKLLGIDIVGFDFPEGYNREYDVIIDPVVVVCSYSGSTNMMFGCASGYDDNGNIYTTASGREGYPVTAGAFSQNYFGGFDIVVSKYNSNGTSRFFSTYIGGDSLDFISSVKVNNNEIVLLGNTYSRNFPIFQNSFDTLLNGISDLVIAKLNSNGSTLLNSTLIGGSNNESGWSINSLATSGWGALRNSDFVCDNNGNVFVTGVTNSNNFPTTPGSISSTLKGPTDAFIFKINPTLSNLIWSTYFGGTKDDDGKCLKLDGNGGVYCLGSTTSTNLPTTPGVISPTKQGLLSTSDMFVAHINPNGSSIIASTYLGTTAGDYAAFMDIDVNNDIYICGHINNSTALVSTTGYYSNPNGYNTIFKINSTLNNLYFKSKFGYQPPVVNPAPTPYLYYTAFRVDSCSNVYLGGFSESYLPVTANQLQPFGGGITDAYMAVFSNNLTSLKFASYFGGPVSHYSIGEHTDYASAAFDKKGYFYTALCSNGGLPTTSGAITPTFTSSGDSIYNDAYLKVDMQTFVNANSSYGANITGCPPFTANFVSTTNMGTTYWNFGNGNTSTNPVETQTYYNLGSYNILLVVTDTNTCNKSDSIKSVLNVINPTSFDLGEDLKVCVSDNTILSANVNAVTYSWSTGQTTPTITVHQPGNYVLTINNGGCNSSDDINLVVGEKKFSERFINVLTPNNDNTNDCVDFSIYKLEEFEFILLDRWGKEHYKINNPKEKWCPNELINGTYFYIVNLKSNCTGESYSDKGYITIFK